MLYPRGETPMPLAQLVIKAQEGDPEAYRLIVDRFRNMALSYAFSILGDHDSAEDASQQAFITAYVDLLSLRNPSAFPGWFRKILRNHTIDLKMGRRILTVPLEHAAEIPSREPSPREAAETGDIRNTVEMAISRLPPSEGEAVRLFYLEEMSLREIMELTGVPAKTIKSRLFTARLRLKQETMQVLKGALERQIQLGDRKPVQGATAEAVYLLNQELQSLQHSPGVQVGRLVDLVCAKGRLLRFAGQSDEAIAAIEEALRWPTVKSAKDVRARMNAEIGLACLRKADYARAEKEFLAAKRLLTLSGGTTPTLAHVYNGLGLCAWGRGNFAKAGRFYSKTLTVSRKLKNPVSEAEALGNLALLSWKGGRLIVAIKELRACLRLWTKIGDRFQQIKTEMNIAVLEENLGRFIQAGQRYKRVLSYAEGLNLVSIQCFTCCNLSNLDLTQNKFQLALEHGCTASKLARDTGDRRSEAIALENVSLAHTKLGQFAEANSSLRSAQAIANEIHDEERLFSLSLVELELLLAEGEISDVMDRFSTAQATLKRKKYLSELPRVLRLEATATLLTKDKGEAKKAIQKAFQEARKQKNEAETRILRRLERML